MAPILRQPESLEKLCNRAMLNYLWNLSSQLIELFKVDGEASTIVALDFRRHVDFLQNYFECRIPPSAYNGIRDEFIKFMTNAYTAKESSDANFLFMVEVFTPLWRTMILGHCQYLDFNVLPDFLHKVFWDGLERMKGMRFIDVSHVCHRCVTGDSSIVRGIARWPELQHFCHSDCSDTILVALSESCPKLSTLDLSASKLITDDSVGILLRFRELKCLKLKNTSLTLNGYRRLMDGLPRLERLDPCGGWPGNSLPHYPSDKTFALTHFYNDPKCSKFTTGQLQFLSTHCPNLRFISIYRGNYVFELSDRKLWCAIEKLCALRLESFNFHTHKILDVLQVKGHHLVYLEMTHVREMHVNSVALISKYCPNLVELILEIIPLDSTPYHHVERVNHPFQHLKHLSLSGGDDHLEYALGDCFNIERINIDIWFNELSLDDRFIDRLLAKNPLQHVRSMHVHDITFKGAQRLVEACPELRTLGPTKRWISFTPADFHSFRCYLRERNYAVVLE